MIGRILKIVFGVPLVALGGGGLLGFAIDPATPPVSLSGFTTAILGVLLLVAGVWLVYSAGRAHWFDEGHEDGHVCEENYQKSQAEFDEAQGPSKWLRGRVAALGHPEPEAGRSIMVYDGQHWNPASLNDNLVGTKGHWTTHTASFDLPDRRGPAPTATWVDEDYVSRKERLMEDTG